MACGSQIISGVILPNGELILDSAVDLAPGPVLVVVTARPSDADETSPWSRLERSWSEQRARHLQTTESNTSEPALMPSERIATPAKSASPMAADLANAMSEISEDCYCAGWMSKLEFELWSAVMNGPVEAGFWKVTQSDIDRLRLLARRCDGWVVWDETLLTETWLPIEEWLRRYDEYAANRAANANRT